MPRRKLAARVDELLERFDLADAAGRVARTYSGGMQRRLDIAMGLVHRPRVLFLDEPTTGLDPEARTAMWEEISRLTGHEGLTILLTTHYLEEADRLASRLAIVDRGRIVAEGTPDELKAGLHGDGIQIELAAAPLNGEVPALLARIDGLHDVELAGRLLGARADSGPAARAGRARRARRGRRGGRVGQRLAAVARRRLSAPCGTEIRGSRDRKERRMSAALAQTRAMTLRHLRELWRQPWFVAIMLVQPLIWLLLFGSLFEHVVEIPGFGGGDYIDFLTPGLVVMTALFSAGWSGMGVIEDLNRGVMDRFLVSPVSRASLIAGRLGSLALTVAIQSLIVVAIGMAVGARFPGGIVGIAVLVGCAVLLACSVGSLSIGLALVARQEETLIASVQLVVLPRRSCPPG